MRLTAMTGVLGGAMQEFLAHLDRFTLDDLLPATPRGKARRRNAA